MIFTFTRNNHYGFYDLISVILFFLITNHINVIISKLQTFTYMLLLTYYCRVCAEYNVIRL